MLLFVDYIGILRAFMLSVSVSAAIGTL